VVPSPPLCIRRRLRASRIRGSGCRAVATGLRAAFTLRADRTRNARAGRGNKRFRGPLFFVRSGLLSHRSPTDGIVDERFRIVVVALQGGLRVARVDLAQGPCGRGTNRRIFIRIVQTGG
jgi:hypothetical protein